MMCRRLAAAAAAGVDLLLLFSVLLCLVVLSPALVVVPQNCCHNVPCTRTRSVTNRRGRHGPKTTATTTARRESSVDDDPDGPSDASGVVFSHFERFVRLTTGDDKYKFGDLTKKTISHLTDKESVLSKTGQVLLGDDSYEFGSITRAKLMELEDALEDWKGLEKDPWKTLLGRAMKDMDPVQRRTLLMGLFQIGATALLTWGFLANAMTSLALTMAWSRTLTQHAATATTAATVGTTVATTTTTTLLPLVPWGSTVTATLWRTWLTQYTAIRLLLDPLFLVIQGGGTLLLFQKYNALVVMLSKTVLAKSTRQRFPILHKLLCLFLAFLLQNVLVSGFMAVGGMVLGGLMVRLGLVFGAGAG